MAIRVIKSSGDVYADLGIKKPRNAHHGSTLNSFLAEEVAPKSRVKGRGGRRYRVVHSIQEKRQRRRKS